MKRTLTVFAIALTVVACAPAASVAPATPATPAGSALPVIPTSLLLQDAEGQGHDPADLRARDRAIQASDRPVQPRSNGAWIGAGADSDFVLEGTSETVIGVWVDVPESTQESARARADVALVIDTSGSMAGPKIENARAAARELVNKLADGDVVSVTAFSDDARVIAPPVVLSASSRPLLLRAIAALALYGGTNMYAGLSIAEESAAMAPTIPVRRVVMISDGIANIGPTSPELLGAVAARGSASGVQVTAIGVGLDYDEHTLDALAMRSNGRLYHLDEPREMSAILDKEVALLKSTEATSAVVEVVPAPGVEILGAEGVRAERAGSAVRVPLGAMFGGQHREMLLRVRVTANESAGELHSLASVRLHFTDPRESGLERVQEVVARCHVTTDAARVEASATGRTRVIAATLSAGAISVEAAQQVSDGRFEDADRKLAGAEAKLRRAAAHARDDADRQRVLAVASRVTKARVAMKADAAQPTAAPAKRARALDLNQAGMREMGF